MSNNATDVLRAFFSSKNHEDSGLGFGCPSERDGPAVTASTSAGRNATRRNPSKSTGTRRFGPQVSNSNPASFGADQAITALPFPIEPTTCSQIISRTSRIHSDIDARADFQQPHREPTPQPGGRVFNHDDQHRQRLQGPERLARPPQAPRPARAARPPTASPRCPE